ncbi:Pkinase-domain-containing protein [Gonapodya prolifera JEL478]|uniref:Pkinase-domain-containing protein n=1 Tax=Gonapodya prolifera (strain JEL478) TaxID=1344416 RepID=A0A139ARY0_GONPJ|nr:Pkinase-domain-containing protein [Gonapodya prolifera JEL478]|eukprot:KXS19508.1 Pkinase-domain-containing protein [Gonapodya prolifera JEL478]
MKRLHHPHIIRMYDHFETKDKHYLVFEMATGGELHERIAERGHFNERDAAIIMATLINAIGFLHKHGVVHRDIKSANVLFRTPSHTSDICLVDFGISRALEEGQKLTDLTGTLAYIAPEILTQRGYGATVDMWAAGVMTYELVSGYQPFHSIDSQEDLFDRILRADFDFPDEWFGQVSDECKDFIKKLIHTNPRTRYTAAQCLEHSWFLRFVPPDYLSILSEINEAAERIKQGLDSPHRIEYHDRKSPGVALDPEEARVLDLMGELLDEEEGKGTHRRVKTFAVTGSDTAIAKAKYGGVLPGVLDVGSLLGGLEGKNLPNLHLKLTRAGGRRRHSSE